VEGGVKPMIEREQRVDQGTGEGQPHAQIRRSSMQQVLETKDAMRQRQQCFHHHAIVPDAALADQEVGRVALCGMKALVSQGDSLAVKALDKRGKVLVMHVGRLPRPRHNLAAAIEQPTELDTDNPAMTTIAFAPDLLRTTALAPRMNQFDAIGVDHGKEGRIGQKLLGPRLVRAQGAQQPRAVGQSRKERLIITREPAIKAAETAAFERAEQTEGDDLARPQLGLRMLGASAEAIIDQTEEVCEKLGGSHGQTSMRQKAEHFQSAGVSARGALAHLVTDARRASVDRSL